MAVGRRRKLATVVGGGDRGEVLRALAGVLAREIDAQQVVHVEGCGCRCGCPPGDARVLVQLAKQLSGILAELGGLDRPVPGEPAKAPVDQLAERRTARRRG